MRRLTGFRDFFPEERACRGYIESVWRATARSYGYIEYDGPPLEDLELFTRKSGDEIVGQLYHFEDKGGRPVALRPEMTPTLARMAAARQRDFRKPIRWFAIPQVFRYESPQKGRLREHFQFNCDLLGEESPAADAEVVALAIDTLRNFGFGPDEIDVRVSDRRFWSAFLDDMGVPEERRYDTLQVIDKSEREPRERTRERLGSLADEVFRVLDEGAPCASVDALLADLDARGLGGFARRDLSIVRGLAYYTGIVFEVFDRSGANRAIAAGGRYDTLLGSLFGCDLPALGFGMGDVVLGNLIAGTPGPAARQGRAVRATLSPDAAVVLADPERTADAHAVASSLRAGGLSVLMPLAAARVGRQFQAAEQAGAAFAVVIGSEWPTVRVKHLATREERETGATAAADFLAEWRLRLPAVDS